MKNKMKIFTFIIVVLLSFFKETIPTQGDENILERINVIVTEFTIDKQDGTSTGSFSFYEKFKIKMNWDASMYGNELHEGDYFSIILPNGMLFPTNTDATDFDVLDENNNVVARAVVTPTSTGGGTIKVTFSDYVENRNNIKGKIWLEATFGNTVIPGQNNRFELTVNGEIKAIELPIDPLNVMSELVGKWGEAITNNPNEVRWTVRINQKKGTYQNVVISDRLTVESGELQGIQYIVNSFKLYKVVINEFGEIVSTEPPIDVSDQIQFNVDKTEFTYDMGNINGEQYLLKYNTTYVPSVKLKNFLTFSSFNTVDETSANYQNASSGGTGQGDSVSKIRVIKTDNKTNVRLSGAEFELKNTVTDATFRIVTDANGEGTSPLLTPGTYYIKEINPPFGYTLDNTVHTVEVTATELSLIAIENEAIKITIPVSKQWIGPVGTEATIRLLADGEEIDHVVLNANNNWQHSFNNLLKYNGITGNEIVYTIAEDVVNAYVTKISGNAKNGFVVINSNAEKITIPVSKQWIGPVGTEATIRLLADGEEIDHVVLNANNNWQHSFNNLLKYNGITGKEIVYTIAEDAVNTYVTKISGNAKNGFIVVNSKMYSNVSESSTPNTSDQNYFSLWLLTMILSSFGFFVTKYYLRKN